MILSADWHLTDLPQDEYRWSAFDALNALLRETGSTDVFILGDLGDRKDKHSGNFVNRVQDSLLGLDSNAQSINILMGNHDKPLRGVPYWSVLNQTWRKGLEFWTKPMVLRDRGLALLPYTKSPIDDWAQVPFKDLRAAFIHQPVAGAMIDGYRLAGDALPLFPRSLKVFAGDIHAPQIVGRVQYVGAPHHVKYGDSYICRMLVVNDETYAIEREVILTPPSKALVSISSVAELAAYKLGVGDQVKIRMSIDAADLEQWPAREAELIAWGHTLGIRVSSIEAVIREQYEGQSATYIGEGDPHNLLAEFAASEGISDALVKAGVECLEATLSMGAVE